MNNQEPDTESIPTNGEAPKKNRALVVVARPLDEALWGGGTMLMCPEWSWHVVSLFAEAKGGKSGRLQSAARRLGAAGSSSEDRPDGPCSADHVRSAVNLGLGDTRYDMIMTHSPRGLEAGDPRASEVGEAVLQLWTGGGLEANELWVFTDGAAPADKTSDSRLSLALPEQVLSQKRAILREVYDLGEEALQTPSNESFWRFDDPDAARAWADS